MEKIFVVQSTDGLSVYKVKFQFDARRLTVNCDCPAGALDKLCKHKLGLLRGEEHFIKGQEQQNVLEVQEWIKQSDYPKLLNELDMSEFELEKLKVKILNVKKSIERLMRSAS